MIEISGVSKRYGSDTVLDGISLAVPEKAGVAIMGPSGSGKTTLLRLIAGLESPDAGEIRLENRLVSSPGFLMPPHLRGIGMVFQSPALWPHMNVMENVGFGIPRKGKEEKRRVEELLERMEIGDLKGSYPGEISGGQARRVALARALAPKPRLLLLDEPLTNLEARLQKDLLDLVREEQERYGFTLVYITHDHTEAESLTDLVLFLEAGTLKPLIRY